MLKTESDIFKRKEEFRLRHRKAGNAKEDVMKRFYGIESNLNAPVRIDTPTLERIVGKYGGNGMICIRTDNAVPDEAANEANTRRIIQNPLPELYVNPMPCQLSERMRRQGEIMVWE